VLALLVVSPSSLRRALMSGGGSRPARLLEQARVLAAGDVQRELDASDGSADVRGLAQVIDALVRQRTQLRGDIAAQVEEASRNVEQERSRLAALMSELTQSVVVCNLDGRPLYNNPRARGFRHCRCTLAAGMS
jgi:DNA polymerase-3 subunit epsilon